MTIKSFKELNKFEKKGLYEELRSQGFNFATSTDCETHETRRVWVKGRISFDEDSMTLEVD